MIRSATILAALVCALLRSQSAEINAPGADRGDGATVIHYFVSDEVMKQSNEKYPDRVHEVWFDDFAVTE